MKKRAKKTILTMLTLAVSLSVMAGILPAAAETVYFSVINETILDLRPEYMPIRYNGMMYLPSNVFGRDTLDIYYSYNKSDNSITFFNAGKVLTFNLNTGIAYDQEMQYNQAAIESGGLIYVPAYFTVSQFGFGYAYIASGPAVRITTDSSTISTTLFNNISKNEFSRRLENYYGSQTTPPPGTSATPSPSPSYQTERTVEVYITVQGELNGYTPAILDVLDEHGVKAAFFLPEQDYALVDDTLLRLIGTGQTVGLLSPLQEETGEGLIRDLSGINDRLREVTMTRARLVQLQGGSGAWQEEGLVESLIGAGYRLWDPTITADEEGNGSISQVAASITARLKASVSVAVISFHNAEETAQILDRVLRELEAGDYVIKQAGETTKPENQLREVR